MSYVPYQSTVQMGRPIAVPGQVQAWQGTDDTQDGPTQNVLMTTNVANLALAAARHDITRNLDPVIEFFNNAMDARCTEITKVQEDIERTNDVVQELISLKGKVETLEQEMRDLLTEHNGVKGTLFVLEGIVKDQKAQLDAIPASAGAGTGIRGSKMPDIPEFSGDIKVMPLEDWLNQLILYCRVTGIVTDGQKILYALSRIRNPATKYLKIYYDKTRESRDLGSWAEFVQELGKLYDQRDTAESAKDELHKLWDNTDLAKKDFLQYAEQYQTLSRLVNIQDEVHINRLYAVVPHSFRVPLFSAKMAMNGKLPTDWSEYLDLLIKIYKTLHPDKVKSTIFGNQTSGSSSNDKGKGKAKDNSSSSASTAQAKPNKYCQHCKAAGKSDKTIKSHNSKDCYSQKQGNQGQGSSGQAPKSTQAKASSSGGATKASSSGTKPRFSKAQRARLLEIIDGDDEEAEEDQVAVNTAQLREILSDSPERKRDIAQPVPKRAVASLMDLLGDSDTSGEKDDDGEGFA